MGAIQSLAKENAILKRYTEWNREKANNLTNRYKALDLEFGLDMDSLCQLLEEETASAEAMTCFGRGNGTVNALEILVAINMVAQGTEDEAIKSMFVVFDFGGIGSTSYDEFAIFMLVVARILVIVAKADPKSEPSDQLIDQIVRQKFAPTDRVEFEQCLHFVNETFPVDSVTKERTVACLLQPFEIPLPTSASAELEALLGVAVVEGVVEGGGSEEANEVAIPAVVKNEIEGGGANGEGEGEGEAATPTAAQKEGEGAGAGKEPPTLTDVVQEDAAVEGESPPVEDATPVVETEQKEGAGAGEGGEETPTATDVVQDAPIVAVEEGAAAVVAAEDESPPVEDATPVAAAAAEEVAAVE